MVSFIGVILLVSASSFLYLVSNKQLTNNSEEVESIHKKMAVINAIVSLLKDIERGQEAFIISGDETFLSPYSTALLSIDKQIEKMDKLLESDIEQRMEFSKLKILIDEKINEAKTTVYYVKNARGEEAKAMFAQGDGKELMTKIIEEAGKIENVENQKLLGATQNFNANSRGNLIIVLGGLTVTLLVILLGVRRILNELKIRQHLEAELFDRNKSLSSKNAELEVANTELKSANETITNYNAEAIKNQVFLFKNVVDSFPSPLLIFNKASKLEFINNAGLQAFAQAPEKVLNQKPEEFLSEEKAFVFASYINQTLLLKKPGQTEIALKTNNKERTFIIRFIPLIDEKEEVRKILVITFDITDRKSFEEKMMVLTEDLEQKVKERTQQLEKLNEELTNQSAETADLYNNAPLGYYSADKTGNFLKINNTSLKLLGYERDEILSKNMVSLLIPEQRRGGFQQLIDELVSNGKVENKECEFIKKDGSLLPVLIYASIDYDEARNVKMSRTAFIDNTELQKAIKDKEKFLEALKTANKELESFSYSISHDLRAPLRSINGFGNILRNEYYQKLDEEGKRYLDIVLYNTKQMGKLIDDLLEFAKLGKKGLNKNRFNMAELIAEVLKEILNSTPKSREIKLEIASLPFVTADRNLIKQVWVNLISNSLKFSSDQPKPEISIFSEDNEDYSTFYVRDNGVGFDSKYSDKLFNVFQRLHSNEEFEGTGVGLAIVQRIVTTHGGKVGAESNLGKGATFYFTIPKA